MPWRDFARIGPSAGQDDGKRFSVFVFEREEMSLFKTASEGCVIPSSFSCFVQSVLDSLLDVHLTLAVGFVVMRRVMMGTESCRDPRVDRAKHVHRNRRE